MNIVKLCGGAEQATTPTSCHAVWAVVVSPNRRCADIRDQIARVIENENNTNTWLRQNPAQMTSPYLQGYFDPVNTPLNHPACASMLEAVRATGLEAVEFSCMPTPSDANFFAEHGQPVIICGPGNLLGNGVHGLNEHIEIDSLLRPRKRMRVSSSIIALFQSQYSHLTIWGNDMKVSELSGPQEPKMDKSRRLTTDPTAELKPWSSRERNLWWILRSRFRASK